MSAEILRSTAAAIRRDHADEFYVAVADWLEGEGRAWQEMVRTHPDLADAAARRIAESDALAVARAYLGEAS